MTESRTALRESQQASDGLPDINAITRELRESLSSTYDEWQEGWFSSIFMGHEQVLEVNGEANRESVSDDEVISATVAPCEEKRTIKIAHFHENVSKTPIPSTRFQVQENTGWWVFDDWETIHSGTTDANGVAEVTVTPGKEYRVVLAPDVSRADMAALYKTYESFIERCCSLLENTWNNGARQEWDGYLSMGSGVQALAVYARFQEGIADGFVGVLDDIRRIYDVICGLLDHDFSNLPDDLREQMENLKKVDDAYLKACLVANDEVFLFLVMYTVRQYFRLLAPTQVAEMSGELVGQILFDVVVGLIITGGAGLAAKYGARIGSKAVAGAMNVADSARVSINILGEFLGMFAKEFQDFMENIGTKHRDIQLAGVGPLDSSNTQLGRGVRNRHNAYQEMADGDEVANLQASGRDHAASSQLEAPPRDEASPSKTDQGRATKDNESTESVADPVSTVTGEEVLELTDARLAGLLPFEFKRVYRSGSSDRRLDMGYGWRHSLNHSLTFDNTGITWHDHEGKNTRLPELDSAPFGINSQAGMAAWREGEEIVVCAGEKSLRYHFVQKGGSGQLVRISDGYGNRLRIEYDLQGRLGFLTNDCGNTLAFDFDDKRLVAVRLLRRELSENGYQWHSLRTERSYSYDDSHDLISAEDAVGGIEHYGYENHMLTSRQLAGGYSFYLEWDELSPKGRCVHQWGDSTQVDTRFEWDDENHTCAVSYVDGSREIWRYDGAAQLQEKIDPDGAKHLNEYDDQGRLKVSIDPMGARTEYQYDKNGRLQSKTGPDGQPTLFTYRKGRIDKIHRNGQTWAFEYTRQGDLASEADPKGRVTRYNYSPQGQLTQVDLPDGRVHKWGWNSQGQLIEETTPTGAFYQYRYDEFGQLLAKI